MALQDLLDAIVTDTQQKLQQAKQAHAERMKELRTQHDLQLRQKKQKLREWKDEQMHQARRKAETHALMLVKENVLTHKQDKLSQIYEDVIDRMQKLPEKRQRAFMEHCLAHVPRKGTILPAKTQLPLLTELAHTHGHTVGQALDTSGGFRFESDDEEHDYTYEFLVHQLLRPKTEVHASQTLFTTHSS